MKKITKGKKVQVVVIAEGHLLLLKTNKERGSFWQNITGSVEKGESFEDACKREFQEETGLNSKKSLWLNIPLSFEFVDRWDRQVEEKCFLAILPKIKKIKIDPHEHQDYKWVSFADWKKGLVKYPSNAQAIKLSLDLLVDK